MQITNQLPNDSWKEISYQKIKSKPNREVLRLEMVSYKSDHDLDKN